MKNYNVNHRHSIFVLIILLILLSSKIFPQQAYNYTGTLSYLDGTPVNMSGSNLDKFEIVHLKSGTRYTQIFKKFEKDAFTIDITMAGEYLMKFMGQDITKLVVNEVNGKLQSNVSKSLSLPLNYVIITDPESIVDIYDENVKLIKSLKADKNGYIPLKGNKNYFSNKFFTSQSCEGLPNLVFLKKPSSSPTYLGNLSEREIEPYKSSLKNLIAKDGLVHQISDNIFYTVQQITFPIVNKTIFVLKVYNPSNKKASIHKINLSGDLNQTKASVALDFEGKLVLWTDQQNYYLSNEGALSVGDDIFIKPFYRFKNNYVKGGSWVIPSFLGIALKPGNHSFELSCNGNWNEVNPAYNNWGLKKNELTERIYHPKPGTTRTGEQSAALQKEYANLIKNEPKPSTFHKEGSIKSSESFEVIFDPGKPNPWKMDGDFNLYKSEYPDAYYYPSGLDPESKINHMEIKECFISVDGSNKIGHSYKDLSLLKGISNADWDSKEEEERARESAIKNAPVYIGGGEDSNSWGSNFELFNQDHQAEGPINMYEGPYPELRYRVSKNLGEYPSFEEAKKHCEKPVRYGGKYRCVETSIVSVCPENYNFSVIDGVVVTNYDALYCGEVEPDENELKGDEIVVEVSADGYITETRALSKRTLEAGNILLSGHITDKSGFEIEGAKVKLKGIDGSAITDAAGIYNITAKAQGTESHSEVMDIKLQKIGIEISNDELGNYDEGKNFGVVSDGFTTLKLKVKVKGIRPETVVVKPPLLGDFVEQSVLKIPLVLDENGEGEMEFVPPQYLKNEDLNKHLRLSTETANKDGLTTQTWVAEIPIEFTYEDEEDNSGTFTMNILVCRPPVLLIHGFTGDETTWATLANYLRVRKYETIVREYYKGPVDESTIERQSQKLGQYIQDLRNNYKQNGILQTRIDIVAHSMGGLISRYYISNLSKQGQKAGIVIPYNVKLSNDELAQMRFKKPVKLIDVRKLIMVGTPNHGASRLDEKLGFWASKSSGSHLIAGSQLRADSQFMKTLNEGESKGRHLDQNVQYAILYGMRQRSAFYPPDSWFHTWGTSQKDFVDDDGVVNISSAKLNGVKTFKFPKDSTIAMNGYIHSSAGLLKTAFPNDEPITESTTIFDKVDELLLKDIPRMPLDNSYSKFIAFEGDASMRYFSTNEWKPINTLASKKLSVQWCQLKTGVGSTSLGFFVNGHHWGALHIMPNSIVYYENASPEFVKVYLQQGKARFRSRRPGGKSFEVVMGDEGEKWYEFNPKAKVRDINTDFIVEEGELLSVQSINGKVIIGIPKENAEGSIGKEISSREGISLNQRGEVSDNPLPDSGWWSDIDTTYLPDEVIKEEVTVEDITKNNGLTTGEVEKVLSDKTKLSEISPVKSNKLPIVDFEIGTVSGGSYDAPVWVKFYPIGTYDPDGYIVLFEMDMDGDGIFDVSEKTLTGGSYEYTNPGKYTAVIRVTDDKGGVTTKSKSFVINGSNYTYTEPQKVYQPVIESKPENVELDKKLDSIIEEYKQHDEEPITTSNEFDIAYKAPIKENNKSENKTDTSRIFGDNLLVNGSFEKGPSVGSFKLFSKGDGIPGWKVTRATVDLVGNYFNSADGSNSLDLNGTSYGELQQQFSTKKGKQYKLSFYMAGNPAGAPTIKKLLVTVGNKSKEYQFDITGKNVRKMGWEYHELIFTAKDKYTILTLESNHKSGPAAAGPVIDNVKVIEIESQDFVEESLTPKVIITDDSTIQPTADSYVYAYSYRNWNEANFGQSELLSVGWHSTGGEKRAYLKFDLPNISADNLISAQLKLFVNNTVGKNKLIMGVYNVLESWEEGFGTFHSGQSEPIDSSGAVIWDYQPAFDDSVFAEFKLRKRRDKSIKVDITTLVKSWLINNSNYGLLLKPQGYLSGRVPTSIYGIYSKEYQDQNKHPILILDIKD